MDIVTLKDLSQKPSKCGKGHKYPDEYNKECNYCVAVFGIKNEQWKKAKTIYV